MRRFLLVLAATAAALVVVLPATAGAATFRGVVIAKDSARKAIVTASANGTISTVRLHAGFKRLPGRRRRRRARPRSCLMNVLRRRGPRRTGKARHAPTCAARSSSASAARLVILRRRQRLRASPRAARPARLHAEVGSEPGDPRRREDRGQERRSLVQRARTPSDGRPRGPARPSKASNSRHRRGRDARSRGGSSRAACSSRFPPAWRFRPSRPATKIALVVTVESDGSFTLVKGENENELARR